MATYYIKDKNGEYVSKDGKRRFKKLSGRKALKYLKTPEGKKKRFMVTDRMKDGDNNIFVELRKQDIKDYRKEERRKQYQMECILESGFTTVPLYSCIEDDDELDFPCEEIIEGEQEEIEQAYIRKEEIVILRKAIDCLQPDERDLIFALYFRTKRATEKEYGDEIGMSQSGVHQMKEKIFKKLKLFF